MEGPHRKGHVFLGTILNKEAYKLEVHGGKKKKITAAEKHQFRATLNLITSKPCRDDAKLCAAGKALAFTERQGEMGSHCENAQTLKPLCAVDGCIQRPTAFQDVGGGGYTEK